MGLGGGVGLDGGNEKEGEWGEGGGMRRSRALEAMMSVTFSSASLPPITVLRNWRGQRFSSHINTSARRERREGEGCRPERQVWIEERRIRRG